MYTLTLACKPIEELKFEIHFKIQQDTKVVKKGQVNVHLNQPDKEPRDHDDAIAEAMAIFQILEKERMIPVAPRELTIEFASSELKRVLAKDALKLTGRGSNDEGWLALYVRFLATKYFETNFKTARADKFYKNIPADMEHITLNCEWMYPNVYFRSKAGEVTVSSHALNRAVSRFVVKGPMSSEEIIALKDHHWWQAWGIIGKEIRHAKQIKLPHHLVDYLITKFGRGARYLYNDRSGIIFVVKPMPNKALILITLYEKGSDGRICGALNDGKFSYYPTVHSVFEKQSTMDVSIDEHHDAVERIVENVLSSTV